MCNLINIHTYIHTYASDQRFSDDRVGLRSYVQFNKYTYIHTYIHTYIQYHRSPLGRINASAGIE